MWIGPEIELLTEMNFMNKIMVSLLAGIAIGLLVAPAKGSETWRRLVDGLDEYKDKAIDGSEDVYESGKHLMKEGKSNVKSETTDLQDRILS